MPNVRAEAGLTAKRQAREAVLFIIVLASLASHRWVRLSSNVRQHKGHSAVPQQKVRLSA